MIGKEIIEGNRNLRPNQRVRFREPNETLLGRFLSRFGVELNTTYDVGYFHQTGYSGNQVEDKHDIAIIEKEDGHVITVPNNAKFFTKLDEGYGL